jgi:hypothetical protein
MSLFKPDLARPAQWRGDKMDYGLAVQVLCQRAARAKGASVGVRI